MNKKVTLVLLSFHIFEKCISARRISFLSNKNIIYSGEADHGYRFTPKELKRMDKEQIRNVVECWIDKENTHRSGIKPIRAFSFPDIDDEEGRQAWGVLLTLPKPPGINYSSMMIPFIRPWWVRNSLTSNNPEWPPVGSQSTVFKQT